MQHLFSQAWINTRQHQMQKGLMQYIGFFLFTWLWILNLYIVAIAGSIQRVFGFFLKSTQQDKPVQTHK